MALHSLAVTRKREIRALGGDTSNVTMEIRELQLRTRAAGLRVQDILADGRYVLLEILGRGAFGEVWKARDEEQDGRIVAIKVLHVEYNQDLTRILRFFEGASKMAELNHPGIVKILDPQDQEDRFHFFVMEFIDGGDLGEAVRKVRLSAQEILDIVLDVGDALAVAHERNWVHRDIKPANILLDRVGKSHLTDFDLIVDTDALWRFTRTGALGTPMYAAPECLDTAKDAGPPADVYSLAMTLICSIKKIAPRNSSPESAQELADQLPFSDPVKAVVKVALDLDPSHRFADAGKFVAALRAAYAPAPVEIERVEQPAEPAEVMHAKRAAPEAIPIKFEPTEKPANPAGVVKPFRPAPEPESVDRKHVRRPFKPTSNVTLPLVGPSTDPELENTEHPFKSGPYFVGTFIVLFIGYIALALWSMANPVPWTIGSLGLPGIKSRPPPLPDVPDAGVTTEPPPPDAGSAVVAPPPPPPSPLDAGGAGPDCPEGMKYIPAAKINIGSLPRKGDEEGREYPIHAVTFEPFCMDVTEVTVGAYKACWEAKKCTVPNQGTYKVNLCTWDNHEQILEKDRPSHPMNCVTWGEAYDFCEWNKKKLPTEEQWEYAARSADGREYPWGPTLFPEPTSRLNACDTRCREIKQLIHEEDDAVMFEASDHNGLTAQVGGYPAGASPFGMLDMAGNVAEWTDSYLRTYECDSCTATARVIRGGSWHTSNPRYVRAARRDGAAPDARKPEIGFRCMKRRP